MKTIFILLMVLCIALPVMSQDKILFSGFNHDVTNVPVVGFGFNIPGTPLYEFAYTNIGEYGSLNAETGWMFKNDNFFISPLAGANLSWEEEATDNPLVYYLTGASGLIAGANVGKIGLWGYGKYKFDFDGDNYFQNGYTYGAGIYIKI